MNFELVRRFWVAKQPFGTLADCIYRNQLFPNEMMLPPPPLYPRLLAVVVFNSASQRQSEVEAQYWFLTHAFRIKRRRVYGPIFVNRFVANYGLHYEPGSRKQ